MAFAQLTFRESLRDIEACLRAQRSKLFHMGIRGKVSQSTLADANERRDWRIYADIAMALSSTLVIILAFFPAENSEIQSIFLSSNLFGSGLSWLGNQLSREVVVDKVILDYS